MHRTKVKKPSKSPSPRRDARRLSKSTIADWVRAHRGRTGEWPTAQSGPIPGSPGDTWGTINAALTFGSRGLPGGSSLAEFLEGYQFNPQSYMDKWRTRLTKSLILTWAQAHYERTGRWPHQHAGLVLDTGGLTWMAVDYLLRHGAERLPGGSSLAILLRKKRGSARNLRSIQLTAVLILKWADAYHERTGRWPTARSGPIPEAPGTTWQAVMTALHSGYRGFKGGTTLGQLLAKHRGAPLQRKCHRRLTINQILQWADAHHARTGHWPIRHSGAIPGTDGETWASVCNAFYHGGRGLPRSSLAGLLAEHRGVRNMSDLPPLSREQILQWADEHFRRTGKWPKRGSGSIPGAKGETWQKVFCALYYGCRGLTGRTSLTRLLQTERGVPSRSAPIGAAAARRAPPT